MKYKIDFGDGVLECWNCGEACDEALLIEWQRNFAKEVNCLKCYAPLLKNDKNVLVVATIDKILVPSKVSKVNTELSDKPRTSEVQEVHEVHNRVKELEEKQNEQ